MLHTPFPHQWQAQVLARPPAILPARHFFYPQEAEEIERGALHALIHPKGAAPFLATFALGFADPSLPSGLWSCPHPHQLCALAGGYAYLLDTRTPEHHHFLAQRPVYVILPTPNLLLFVGSRTVTAWAEAQAWESPRLSDEGITITSLEPPFLLGRGWELAGDRERPFRLDLRTGSLA